MDALTMNFYVFQNLYDKSEVFGWMIDFLSNWALVSVEPSSSSKRSNQLPEKTTLLVIFNHNDHSSLSPSSSAFLELKL